MMILALGFSYYNIINRIEDSTQTTIEEMMEIDRAAADERLEIQSVKLTAGNSLNLTIKNTGNVFSELKWIGVFDETNNTDDTIDQNKLVGTLYLIPTKTAEVIQVDFVLLRSGASFDEEV